MARPSITEIETTTIQHVKDLYDFYGVERGHRIARKHISWYTKGLKNSAQFRFNMNQIDETTKQIAYIKQYFNELRKLDKYITYEDHENELGLVA